jgi:hypothetical protein
MILKYKLNGERVNDEFDVWKKGFIPDNGYFGITLLPYVFLLIVAIGHNVIQGNIINDCIKLSSEHKVTTESYDKTLLNNIKTTLKEDIMKGDIYDVARYKEYEYVAKEGALGSNKININIKDILDIYIPTHDDNAYKKRKVLGYIDRYFELLEYKNSEVGYTYYYFTGLINPETTYSDATIKKRYYALEANIQDTRGKQYSYYLTVIVTYAVICGIGILYFFINNLYSGWVSLLLFGGALFTRNRIWLLILVVGLITLIVHSYVDKKAQEVLSYIVGFVIVILLLRFTYTRFIGMLSK